jgi:hypothetical protein
VPPLAGADVGALLYGAVSTIGWLLALVAFERRDLVG